MSFVLNYLDKKLSLKRSYEEAKAIVDTFAVVSALLLYVPIEAITRFDFHDWDYFHELSEICHPDADENDPWSFKHVIQNYKEECLLCTSLGLMVIVGVCLFSVLVNDEMSEKYGIELNLFILWLTLLVTCQMILVILIFEYMFQVFSSDSEGVQEACKIQ